MQARRKARSGPPSRAFTRTHVVTDDYGVAQYVRACARCHRHLPADAAHFDTRGRRYLSSECRPCRRERQREDHAREPWKRRNATRRHYREVRAQNARIDSVLKALDGGREPPPDRRRVGVRRAVLQDTFLPAGPFAQWIREVQAARGIDNYTLAEIIGVSNRQIRRLLNDSQPLVKLTTVDEALVREGSTTLVMLYPPTQ